ncbi:MAG: DUF881 domain-containing protein [Alicyclobacillus sp.]|nr:DUF881 domain-containing protein [Alicyclobacillus sp.]
MKRNRLIWSLTGVAAVLGFLLTVQLTSAAPAPDSGSLSSYIDLKTEVEEQAQEHVQLLQQIAKAESQVQAYKNAKGHQAAMMEALQQDAATVAKEAGLTSVTGPGITIAISFDPSLPYNASTAGLFDQDADQELGLIVNDLFANGAQAISINGQRLVTTSSIRLVAGLGGTSDLQVNTVPIESPYVITAVGDIQRMQAILTLNDVVTELALMQERCTITPHTGAEGVTVAGYQGPLPGNFAKEVHNG